MSKKVGVAVSQKTGIKTLQIGKQFTGFCVVRKKELRYKSNGEAYLHLELGDWSGRLTAKIWDDIQKNNYIVEVGRIVKIQAVVQQFQDRKELKIVKLRRSQPDDEVDSKLLLPKSDKDISKLRNRFAEHVGGLENHHLKELLSNLFSEEKFTEQFFSSPAGKLWHHNYLYGMLEHVVAMLDIADIIICHYPLLNSDLLKCGIILHDVGKMKSYDAKGFFDFTDKGRLLGHITIGYDFVKQKIEEIKDFPEELGDQILHMTLSHQGRKEEGSPVLPMTIESIVLHYINELDSKANALSRIIEKDILTDSKWSKYIPLLNRFIYYNKEENPEKE